MCTKGKTRELRQIHTGTADPVGIDSKSCLFTIMECIVYWRDFRTVLAGSAVSICLNSLVFQFVSSSICIQLLNLCLLHLRLAHLTVRAATTATVLKVSFCNLTKDYVSIFYGSLSLTNFVI